MGRLNADAQLLLSRWTPEQVDSVWRTLQGTVASQEAAHGGMTGAALDWINQYGGSPEFVGLLDEVDQIDFVATGRHHKPLPRLLAVVVIKAVASGDAITATKAIGPVLESLNQARRRIGAHSADVLTVMIGRYLQSSPDSSNLVLEQHLAEIAKAHPLFHEPEEPFVLDYVPRPGANDSKTLTRIRLQQRISKVRRRLGIPVPKRVVGGQKPCGMITSTSAENRSRQCALRSHSNHLLLAITTISSGHN